MVRNINYRDKCKYCEKVLFNNEYIRASMKKFPMDYNINT